MSKIKKRNYVKKNMDKFHKPKKEMSGKLYQRSNERVIVYKDAVEGIAFALQEEIKND